MADPVPPPTDLPAPYASPWGRLGGALRAVVASLRLKLRELWRRNGEGDLSVPGFWPQGLAPLFWPLVLAALLALALTLAGQAWRGLAHRAVRAPGAAAVAPLPAPAPERQAPRISVSAPAQDEPPPVAKAAPMPLPEPEPPPPLELDPLLALLADDDPDHLIASAHPVPAEGRLELTMAPAYTALPPASRGRWAERWQQRAQALGYERLELVDGRQRLLARRALVGSGMILLDPGAPG
jgi:hypothetical protein